MALRRLPHGMALAMLVALLAALLAGCGGDQRSAGPGPDPATVAPAGATLYGQVVVRPTGDMKAGVEAVARKVLRVDEPGAELVRLLDAHGTTGDTRFSRDVEPWLGRRVGGFVSISSSGAEPDWALAFAIADRSALDDALARMRKDGSQHEAGSYRGVTYDRDDTDDTYSAAVGDFYVDGSLGGLRAAIDASRGTSLADASRFTDAVDAVPDDALAFLYADPKAVAAAGDVQDAPPAMRQAIRRYAGADPVVASLTARADEIALDVTADQQLTSALASDSDAQAGVGQLPGDAWLALATPPLGPIVRQALDAAGVHDAAAAQARRAFGLDLDRDVLAPLGGLGLFARGASPLDIGGGVLVQMTSATAAQRLVTRIEAIVVAGLHVAPRPVAVSGARGFQVVIPQSPQPIVVLAKGDKLAAGYAASSAQDLLDPQQRLDESTAGKAAIETLGDGYTPSFVLIVPPLAALLRSLDQLQVADLSSVLPYVNAYRSLAAGTKRDGDHTSVRVVAALH